MKFMLLLILAIIISYSISNDNELKLWNFLREKTSLTEEGAAALMGNLYAQSGLKSDIYDIADHPKLGLTDSEYVDQINSGQYPITQFENDNIGFGLALWRDIIRKQHLFALCMNKVGDFYCQLNYIVFEIENKFYDLDFSSLYSLLISSHNIWECNLAIMKDYLKIDPPSYEEIFRRQQFAKGYYNTYASKDK